MKAIQANVMTSSMPPIIFIPPPGSVRPQRFCPSCHKPENKIEVCSHCRYEYPEDPVPTFVIVIAWLTIFGAIAGFFFLPTFISLTGEVNFTERIAGLFFGCIGTLVGSLFCVGFIALGQITIERVYGKKP